MKTLLALLVLCFMSINAYAVGIDCVRQTTTCDEGKGYYLCTLYGWGHGEFCSETDVSRRPNGTRPEPQRDCAECHGQPRPDKFCKEVCGCTSVFCGSW